MPENFTFIKKYYHGKNILIYSLIYENINCYILFSSYRNNLRLRNIFFLFVNPSFISIRNRINWIYEVYLKFNLWICFITVNYKIYLNSINTNIIFHVIYYYCFRFQYFFSFFSTFLDLGVRYKSLSNVISFFEI